MLTFVALFAATALPTPPPADFSAARMLDHIRVLSSDAYEGRGPGTPAEDKTVAYLVEHFRAEGLEPGNPDGTFIQKVPLAGTTSHCAVRFTLRGQTVAPEWINDYIAFSPAPVPAVNIHGSDVLFCGYGVVAPEYRWNDFKGVDVRGKTIVVLVNDPPVRDPKDPSRLDPNMFKGAAMTYYGRWMYKYEEAARLGAAACFIVHETGPAGYPFAVVAASQGRENFSLRDRTAPVVPVAGWFTLPMAQRLFAAAGYSFAQLKAAAVSPNFRPVSFHGTADLLLQNTVRQVDSRNVVAKVTGSDPQLRNEYVIYSAHWDHLGRDPRRKGDQIFHGAKDNASGTAALLELARAFAALPPAERPPRTIIFLSVTAEEKGLLGSEYYAQHPLYPLTRTLADLNMDVINTYERTLDVESVGYGSNTLDDLATALAHAEGRTIHAESNPERGTYYRSDHFEFAKVGVPSCMIKGGKLFAGHDAAYGQKRIDDYTTNDYHKVTDVIKPDWTMDGAVQDADFLYRLGWAVAEARTWPTWAPDSEFKSRRDAMLLGSAGGEK